MTAIEARGRRSPSLGTRAWHYLRIWRRQTPLFRRGAFSNATSMLQPARREDVAECYRAILGREPENASTPDGYLHGRPLLRDVVAKIAHSSELRAKHLRSNIAFDRARDEDYLARSFRGMDGVAAHYGHYGFLVEALTAPALKTLLAGHAVLHVHRNERAEYRVLVTATHERHEEGELQLQLHDGYFALYVIGVTVVPGELFGLADRQVLLISRVQGIPGAFLAIREATKAFGDIQPRAVLLAAAEGLAKGLGLKTVVAVAASNQLAADKREAPGLAQSYDELFTGAGGEPLQDGFFRLDLARECRPPAAASRSHAKRAERRRQQRRDIAAAAAREAVRWLK